MLRMQVQFDKPLRRWDGFGINYVEIAQTDDYERYPQDYGGLSTLAEEDRQAVLDAIFGEDGLQPTLVKMFFGPFMQAQPLGETTDAKPNGQQLLVDLDHYDHTTTTPWMRYFVQEGLRRTRERGEDLKIVTTMYAPPAFMTKQGFLRGRDLDPQYLWECAKYMAAWVKYLRDVESLPVTALSLHNEGEDHARWPEDADDPNFGPGHDYNLYWPPELLVEMLPIVRQVLDANGLSDVLVAPGETTNWYRFDQWGYAAAIADDPAALDALGLISSHGFLTFNKNRWFADTRSVGNDLLRQAKPGLHSWVTSIAWGDMDVHFLEQYRHNIYSVKVNGLIPWACMQNPEQWHRGDPNPGTAFRIDGKGGWQQLPGYDFYKQVCRWARPGMDVAQVSSNDTQLGVLAFASGQHATAPDVFVVLNTSTEAKTAAVALTGTEHKQFCVYRTTPDSGYQMVETVSTSDGALRYDFPAESATTFVGCEG